MLGEPDLGRLDFSTLRYVKRAYRQVDIGKEGPESVLLKSPLLYSMS